MNYNQHTVCKSRNHEWNNFIHLSSREVMIDLYWLAAAKLGRVVLG